jgi:O-antigen ligase
LTGQGLWRAASTLTYENALAALLTGPALLSLDRLLTDTESELVGPKLVGPKLVGPKLVWSEAAYLLLVGIGATLSRGGLLGLVVGLAVLVVLRGPRRLLRLVPPVLGSLASLACLAPGLPVTSPPHMLLAYTGLVIGAVVTAVVVAPGPVRAAVSVAVLAALAVVVAVASGGPVAHQIAQARFSPASSDRAHEWAAAVDVARHHLVLGSGLARVLLQWQVGGQIFTASFAHNEFLQLLTQDGVVGLVVLVVGLLAVFVGLARRRGRPGPWSAECALACLVALLIQSSLDFLWHLTVVPVLMAVIVALAMANENQPAAKNGEDPVKGLVGFQAGFQAGSPAG